MSFNSTSRDSLRVKSSTESTSQSSVPLDIAIYNFIELLKRHKLVVLIPVILAEGLALYTYFVLVTYTATSSLIIQKADTSSLQSISIDLGATKPQLIGSPLAKDTYLQTILVYLNTTDSFFEAAKNIYETEAGKKLYRKLKDRPRSNDWLHNLLNFFSTPKTTHNEDPVTELAMLIKSMTRYSKASVPGYVVSVTTHSPKISIALASMMAEQSQAQITRRELKQLEEGKNYILNKMDEISDSLAELEKEMLSIRKDSIGPVTQKGGVDSYSSLNTVRADLEENRIKLEQNEKLISSLLNHLKPHTKGSNISRSDLTTQAIVRRQLAALRARKEGLLSEGMAQRSPQVRALQEEIEQTEKQLKRNLAIETDNTKDGGMVFLEDNINPELRITELKKENFLLKTRINAANKLLKAEKLSKESLPEAEQKYYALNKRLEMKYLLFGDLSKQLFNIDVNRIAIQNRVVNIEAASSYTLSRQPTLTPLIPMVFILALVFSTLVAVIIEGYDPTVVTAKDLPGFNYVSLGNIPLLKEAEKIKNSEKEGLLKSLIFRHKLDLPQTIPFKRIRTRLLHLDKELEQKSKIISVHSTHSGDGKSFITGNLAASLAALNKKTLLIDCDLRKKALTRELTKKDTKGLVNFLQDPNLNDFSSLIIPNLQPNLDLLPSGPASSDSSELINSPRFSSLLERVRKNYDFVLLDDAPFLALPDSEIVANHSDIIIAVASCHRTKVHDLSTMLDHFLQFGEKTVCLILNRASTKNQVYYYYGVNEEKKPRARAA